MSYRIHIPIDDIRDADIEEDLLEVERLSAVNSENPSGKIEEFEDYNAPELQPQAPGFIQNKNSDYSMPENYVLGQESRLRSHKERLTDTDNSLGDSETKTKVYTDLDLALARNRVDDSKRILTKDNMADTFWGNMKGGKEEGRELGELPRWSDARDSDDVSRKDTFVNSLLKKHSDNLRQEAMESTAPPSNRIIHDLISDMNKIGDEEDEFHPKLSEKDMADEMKLQKFENVQLKKESTDSDEEAFPYAKTGERKVNGGTIKEVTSTTKANFQRRPLFSQSGVKDATGRVNIRKPKHKRKHRKHEKSKKGHMVHSKESEIHNEAVAKMVDIDAKTFQNESAVFNLVNKGKDVIDLPISESDDAWAPKIHGRRGMMIAGSIVICLGIVIFIAAVITLIRQRAKRRNINNNKRYIRFGTASETEILRKPQRSLFPLESSEDDDDDESTSESEEDTVYNKKITYKKGKH